RIVAVASRTREHKDDLSVALIRVLPVGAGAEETGDPPAATEETDSSLLPRVSTARAAGPDGRTTRIPRMTPQATASSRYKKPA
ncbi:MAG: hypothetical protein J5531_03485, partial [Lachnospiraceae bacterium]|nr:hypothetical protein [Lachnospiraceae bacterium]